MNILFVSYWYPTPQHPLKGIFIKKHAHAVASAGCQVCVLSLCIENSSALYKKETLRSKDEAGIETIQILIQSRFYKFLHVLPFHQYRLIRKEFTQLKSTFDPNLIHSNVLYPAGILGHMLSKEFSKPHVITEHWSKIQKFMSKSLYASLGKKAYRDASAITVVSDFLKGTVCLYASEDKIHRVPNVINNDVFCYTPKAITGDALVFTCVAHWHSPKRPDLIFHALQKLTRIQQKKIRLNVIGTGPLLTELKKGNWSFDINYLGQRSPSELASTLQQSDYFLHASDVETFSVVIAEALCTGTPVLASNKGAIPELLNTSNGILCDNTLESWEHGIEQLINIKYDYEHIAQDANRFSGKMIGRSFRELYERIIGS